MSPDICPACASELPGPDEPGYMRVPVWLTASGVACSEKCARHLDKLRKESP